MSELSKIAKLLHDESPKGWSLERTVESLIDSRDSGREIIKERDEKIKKA